MAAGRQDGLVPSQLATGLLAVQDTYLLKHNVLLHRHHQILLRQPGLQQPELLPPVSACMLLPSRPGGDPTARMLVVLIHVWRLPQGLLHRHQILRQPDCDKKLQQTMVEMFSLKLANATYSKDQRDGLHPR